jgi:hypothetical protein
LLKENPLKMSEFLKNKYSLLKENLLVLPEFLKNKYYVKGKSPKNVGNPEDKYFFNKIYPSYILILENYDSERKVS